MTLFKFRHPKHTIYTAIFGCVLGFGTLIQSVSAETLPQNPTGLSSASITTSSVRITWTPAGAADYFWLYRNTAGSPSYSDILAIISGSNNSYTDTGLQPGTTYYYRVRAARNYAEAPLSSAPIITVTTLGSTNSGTANGGSTNSGTSFKIARSTTSSITLSWPALSSIDTIKLYRSNQGPDSFFFPLATLSSWETSYNDNGLTPSTTYYYRLTTVKNGVESPINLSAVVKGATTPYTVIPTLVNGFNAVAQAGYSILLTWNFPGNPDNFHLFRNSYGSYGVFESLTQVPGTARAYMDSNLQPGVTYYYRLTSIANGIETPLANAPQTLATAVNDPTTANNAAYWWYNYPYYSYSTYPSTYPSYTNPTYPSYANNLTVSAVSDTRATLSWTITGTADTFTIYQSPDNVIYTPADSVAGTVSSYTARYLWPGSKYWFKITSSKNYHESPLSAATAVTITTKTDASQTTSAGSSVTTKNSSDNEQLLVPSRTTAPITFSFGSARGTLAAGQRLSFRYQFKNTSAQKKGFVFKEEVYNQYGSVLDTTSIIEVIKAKATLTTPVSQPTATLPAGLYTFKVKVSEQTGKTTRYIGENDFRFRVQ